MLTIEYRAVAALAPFEQNPRTHSAAQVAQIAASIREFGWTNPILIDGAGGIIAGHGRALAAASIGMADVPVIVLDHLTAAQRRALVIADNKLALNAGWDDDLLRLELGALRDMDFDLSLTGFDPRELAAHLLADDDDDNVKQIDVSAVKDIFWITIEDSLMDQAEVLTRMKKAMVGLVGVSVELGTINRDG